MINLAQKFKIIIFFAVLISAGFAFAGAAEAAYFTSGNWTSVNLLSGEGAIGSIDSFVYNLSALPANTTSTVQFSQDGTNWYDSLGNLGGSNTMTTGANQTIDLSGLNWSGANFYYKITFTSDGVDTPVLDDISVYYTANQPPNTPTNVSPSAGATGVGLNPDLVGSAFSDPESDSHIDTQWQVDDDSDFSSPVWTRTAGSAETSTQVATSTGTFANELAGKTELDHNSTYYWRVRYSDGAWSSWSTATNFTTNLVNAPTNSSPANSATLTTLTPLLEASAFSDDQSGHTHAASQWLIDDNSDFSSPVYDSGETSSAETSRAVPGGTLTNYTTYYWKVRYKDSSGFWSNYSTPTSFSIQISETAVEVRPVFGNTTVDQGDTVKIDVQVINFTDGSPLNNATATINIYNPSGTKIVDGAAMTYVTGSNGIYRYSYTVPSTSGSYLYEVTATQGSKSGYGASNFEVRTIYSDIADIKSDVSYIRTQIDSLQTKVDTIDTNLDTIVAKWGSYSASDIVGYVDGVEAALGDNADTCAVDDTVFGNIQCVRDKWGTQTADTIYTAANNAYTTIQNVQTELGYNGKTDSAYDDIQTLKGYVDTVESGISDLDSDLASHESAQATERTAQAAERTAQAASRTKVEDIQTRVTAVQSDVSTIKSDVSSAKSTIEDVKSKLNTLAGTLPSGYTGVYEQLVSIANNLSGLGVLKGSGAESLYSLSAESKNDIKYLKNKILDLRAAIEINRILLTGGAQSSVFSTWYTFHSVVLNMLIANPTNRKAKIPFKAYLPKEVKQEHIISSGGLKIEYDEAAGSYVALGEFELEGGESITREVEMKDIWLIDEGELSDLRAQAEELAKEAEGTAYSGQVTVLKNDTLMRLERILRKQIESDATPQDHILAFRENLEDLEVVKENLKKMTDLVTSAGAGRGLLASIGGINTVAAWGIIIALVTGVVLLGLTFYSLWKHQMMIAAQLAAGGKVDKSLLRGGRMDSSDGGTMAEGIPALISLPKIDWQKILPWLKKIFLILMTGLVVFGVIKGVVYFKPWEKLKKQEEPAVMAPVETKKETTLSPSPTPTPDSKKVTILETGTGWLNVRKGPGISFEKVTRVDVGKEFVELDRETNEAGEEWVKIRIDEETEGWVFGEYIK